MIVCGSDTVTIDEPAADDTPRDARLAEEVLANGQLVLPLTTGHVSRPLRRLQGHTARFSVMVTAARTCGLRSAGLRRASQAQRRPARPSLATLSAADLGGGPDTLHAAAPGIRRPRLALLHGLLGNRSRTSVYVSVIGSLPEGFHAGG